MPEKTRHRLPSIRSQIALLVLACALPTVVGFAAVVHQFYARERDTLMEDTRQAARTVAAALDRDLLQSESAMNALAASPSLHHGAPDLNALRLQAGSLLGPQFPASQFILSDSAGKLLMNVGAPPPAALSQAANAERLRPLQASVRPQLSLVFTERNALLAVDVPVLVDSRLAYVLTVLQQPGRLAHILADEQVSPQQAVTLYSADGVVMAQAGGPRMLLGQQADPLLRQHMRASAESLLATTASDGEPIYLGISRLPVSGAVVAIATPQAQALKELLGAVTAISLTMALVLLGGFSLAWLVGGRISRSVHALLAPAQALADGKTFTLEAMTFREADAVGLALRSLEADLRRHRHELQALVAERTGQLEKSRAQLETLYATAPVGLSYVDAELRIIRINDYLAALNRLTVTEHLGRHIGDVIADPSVRQGVLHDHRTVLETGQPLAGIERAGYSATAPDQLCHWVLSYYPQFDARGKVVAITGLVLDITEQKRIEAELRQSKQLFKSVVENMPAIIIVKRALDLRYEVFNHYGAALMGVPREQLEGRNDADFVPAEQAAAFAAADRMVLASREVTEIAEEALTNPAGETRYLTTRKVALRDASGEATHLLCMALDITERKQAEEVLKATTAQLAHSEHFIRTIADNLPGMVAYWDAGQRCRFANRYYLEWHGRDEAGMLDAHMPDVLGPEQYAECAAYIEGALAGRSQGFAGRLRWPSGAISHTWINYIPDVGDDGAVRGFFMLVSDVTELKETELHLQELNEQLMLARDRAEAASRAKSEFLSNMSHEIRTPMNAIIGMTRLMEEAQLGERERNHLDKIQQATQSLLGVLNDVLNFSHLETGQHEAEHVSFHLEHILGNVALLVAGDAWDKGVETVLDIAPDLPAELIGDPLHLQQVLHNLAGNAVKFTERGEVLLAVRRLPTKAAAAALPDARQAPSAPGRSAIVLEFIVRDSGIGIPVAQQEGIFDAFSQADNSSSRKYGGAGLGLAICRRLAGLLGGAISVDSAPGRGSEFRFLCPLEFADDGAHAAAAAHPAAGRALLVVDDNPSVRAALQRDCAALGWRVDSAADAASALAMLQDSVRLAARYDLLLLDRDLPGQDGPALLRQIHADMTLALPPVVLMAPEHEVGACKRQAGELGLAGVLGKPLRPSRLRQHLDAISGDDGGAPAPADGARGQAASATLEQHLHGMHILLVEDNEINQEVAQYILRHAGASIDIAVNGKLALELLTQAPERYDVVLMDVQMPVMNGYDATAEIRRLGAQGLPALARLPVIAMTANVMEDDRRQAVACGMNAHIAKPIEVDELIAVLRKLVAQARLDRPASADLDTGAATGAGGGAARMVAPADVLARRTEPGLATPRAAPTALPSLPGIDMETALHRLGGNHDALIGLLKRFEQSQGGTVSEVHSLLAAGQPQQAAQALHRLRGVAANLGAGEVAALTARAEAALQALEDKAGQGRAGHATLQATLRDALALLEQALTVLSAGVRAQAVPVAKLHADNIEVVDMPQKLAQLQALLQNNNLKALEHFQQLQSGLVPALASAEQVATLADALQSLDFKAAQAMLAQILLLPRKDNA